MLRLRFYSLGATKSDPNLSEKVVNLLPGDSLKSTIGVER